MLPRSSNPSSASSRGSSQSRAVQGRSPSSVKSVGPLPRIRLPPPKESLYDRLGGIFAIAAVIDHFSDALIVNPLVGQGSPNEQLDDWSTNHLDRLPGLKWMRTLWLAALAGGPYKFVATRPGKCPFGLENAHAEFLITPDEFDEVAAELARSLDYFQVPAPEKNETLAAFAAHKPEVTHAVTGSVIRCPGQ